MSWATWRRDQALSFGLRMRKHEPVGKSSGHQCTASPDLGAFVCNSSIARRIRLNAAWPFESPALSKAVARLVAWRRAFSPYRSMMTLAARNMSISEVMVRDYSRVASEAGWANQEKPRGFFRGASYRPQQGYTIEKL